jgi:hypothetical protein
MLVNKLDCQEYKEGGKELKVFYYASAAAAYNGNLPYITANRLIIKAMYFI